MDPASSWFPTGRTGFTQKHRVACSCLCDLMLLRDHFSFKENRYEGEAAQANKVRTDRGGAEVPIEAGAWKSEKCFCFPVSEKVF